MNEETIKKLIEEAKNIADKNTCCKHSGFTVGAALLTSDDEIYTGFNIENDGIQSICAERSAFINALVHGKKSFKAIATVGKFQVDSEFGSALPCGYCRQFMMEYASQDLFIYTIENNEIKTYKLSELLPHSFNF